MEFQAKNYKQKKNQELNFWVDLPNNYIENLPKSQLESLEEQHSSFTMSNGVALIQNYLTSKYPENEDFVRQLSDKWFDDLEGSQSQRKSLSV